MKIYHVILTSILTAICVIPLNSYADSTALTNSADDIAILQKNIGASDIGDSAFIGNGFSLTTGKANNIASIKLAPATGPLNLGFTLSSPISKKTDSATFYDGDAVTNATMLNVNIQFSTLPKDIDSYIQVAKNIRSACRSYPTAFELKKSSDCDSKDLNRINDLVALYREKDDPDHQAYREVQAARLKLLSHVQLYGLNLGIGREEHDYIASGTTNKQSVTDLPQTIGVYYSFLMPKSWAMTIAYDYQRGLKDQSTDTVCNPTPDANGFIHCVQGSIGAPTKNTNRLLSLTFRTSIDPGFAMATKFSYDLEDKKSQLLMPLYFFQDNKDKLNGGMTLSWNDSDKKWQVGLFVGSNFNLL